MSDTLGLGDITIGRVGELTLRLPVGYFYPDLGPDDWAPHADWLAAEGAYDPAEDTILLPVQSYLVRTRHHTIVVDTCIGNGKDRPDAHWHRKADSVYLDNLGAHGVSVDDVDYVLCTHLHMDHAGWNTRRTDGQWVPTFPNARYVFSRDEVETERTDARDQVVFTESVAPVLDAGRADLLDAADIVAPADGGFNIDDEVWLESTPGHTPGHYAVRLASSGSEAVIGGDLMHTPVQCLHPEWRARPDWDPDLARATRREFMERHAADDRLVIMAHFPLPSAGRFRPEGDTVRFVYDSAAW